MYAVHEVSELLFDVQIVSVTGKLRFAISMLYSSKTVKPHTEVNKQFCSYFRMISMWKHNNLASKNGFYCLVFHTKLF